MINKKNIIWILAGTFLSALVIYHFGLRWTTLANLILTLGLLRLAYIDFKYYLLPDRITLPLLWLGLFCNMFELFVPLDQAVLGAMAGYLSLYLIAAVFKYFRGIDGMGQGDFKLLAVFGAWWGFTPLVYIVMMASLLGVTVGLIQIARGKHQLQQPMAFGPYLILAGLPILFFNKELTGVLW